MFLCIYTRRQSDIIGVTTSMCDYCANQRGQIRSQIFSINEALVPQPILRPTNIFHKWSSSTPTHTLSYHFLTHQELNPVTTLLHKTHSRQQQHPPILFLRTVHLEKPASLRLVASLSLVFRISPFRCEFSFPSPCRCEELFKTGLGNVSIWVARSECSLFLMVNFF